METAERLSFQFGSESLRANRSAKVINGRTADIPIDSAAKIDENARRVHIVEYEAIQAFISLVDKGQRIPYDFRSSERSCAVLKMRGCALLEGMLSKRRH